jgi:hypothetical protein
VVDEVPEHVDGGDDPDQPSLPNDGQMVDAALAFVTDGGTKLVSRRGLVYRHPFTDLASASGLELNEITLCSTARSCGSTRADGRYSST